MALKQALTEDGISVLPLQPALPSSTPKGASYLDLYTFTIGNDDTYNLSHSFTGSWDPKRWKMVVKNSALQVVDLLTNDVYADFAVIAIGPGNTAPTPGDDIQIAFEVDTNEGVTVSAANEAPRLAVYDKKMLWRANLYIDEGGGKADWNDRHPWIGDEDSNGNVIVNGPNYNDWNNGQGGQSEGKGGQIPILSFSSPRFQPQQDNSINDDVKNTVAYDYPGRKSDVTALPADPAQCMDTPALFNQKMQVLKTELGQTFNLAGNVGVGEQPGNFWNQTTAPQHRWENYLRVATNDNALPGVGLLYYDWVNGQPNLDPDLVSAGAQTPGQLFQFNVPPYNVSPNHIGTDCVGFSENSVSYPHATIVGIIRLGNIHFLQNGLSTD